MIRSLLLAAALFCTLGPDLPLYASEKEILDLARLHYRNGEYYNAITETMRYQHLYPEGLFYPESLILMGESYYRGGNYYEAVSAVSLCYDRYKNSAAGERALMDLGYMRMLTGSPFYAYRTFQEYQYIYMEGRHREEAALDACYAQALMNDLPGARKGLLSYRSAYPDGKYMPRADALQSLLDAEEARPRKSYWTAAIGSIFLPGFGHFYAGKYDVGIFSFFTNAVLIYLIYNGYRNNDKVQMLVFGLAEFSFYQYSLFSAIGNVHEYNRRDPFYKSVRLSVEKRF